MPVRGRPAIFPIIFLSVPATISALYALVIGSLKLLRSRGRRKSAPDPRDAMAAVSWRQDREQDD
jgi:hypothetical protein